MMLVFSPQLLKYLFMEWKWIKSGRPDEISDRLEDVWYEMSKQDQEFCFSRGNLVGDTTWVGGNGFQFQMLDEMEEQLCAPVPQG